MASALTIFNFGIAILSEKFLLVQHCDLFAINVLRAIAYK